jgi:hypothetical protein
MYIFIAKEMKRFAGINLVPSGMQYELNDHDLEFISFMHFDLGNLFSKHDYLFLS